MEWVVVMMTVVVVCEEAIGVWVRAGETISISAGTHLGAKQSNTLSNGLSSVSLYTD